jgi:type II secretory pathway component PulF
MQIFNRITLTEKLFFAKHLSMFIKAGIPLNEALLELEDDKKSTVGRVVWRLRRQIEDGQSLGQAIAKDGSFDRFFGSIIEIGETSGTLEKSLDFLAVKLAREDAINKKVRAVLYYPMLVVAVSLIIGGFVSFFVLPKLSVLFRSFDAQLPLITRILLFVADNLKNYGVAMLVTVIILFSMIRFFLNISASVRFFWHKNRIHIPVIGTVIKNAALAALVRNLGIMLGSGLMLERALTIEAEIADDMVIKKLAMNLGRIVSEGKTIGEELRRERNIFPKIATRMISVGEASGKLEESFLYLADFLEDETETQAKNAAAALEPLLLLFIGLVVGFVALAVILPIYSLTGSIHR